MFSRISNVSHICNDCALCSIHRKLHTINRPVAMASLVHVIQAFVGLCECTHQNVLAASVHAIGVLVASSLDTELSHGVDHSHDMNLVSGVSEIDPRELYLTVQPVISAV